MHGDWLVALATVIAAIVGVVGGYFLARYQRERKILRFVIRDPVDLAATLRGHGNFEIKFKDFSTTELILSTVESLNIGNASIKDIRFSLKLPGEHPFVLINCSSQNRALAEQVDISSPALGETSIDRVFPGALPFLNTGESFTLNVLYTGKPSQCEVTCRVPDTTVGVYTFSMLSGLYDRRNRRNVVLTGLITAAFASLLVFGIPFIVKQLFLPG